MLRQLTSYQLAEVEAYLRVEAQPVTAEDQARMRDQQMRDLFARFKPKVSKKG